DPYSAVRWLRAHERFAFVQVFIFAAFGSGFRLGDAIAAGSDDVFDASHPSGHGVRDVSDRIVARIARSEVLARLAMLDPLTSVHNRRFVRDRLPAEVARAA